MNREVTPWCKEIQKAMIDQEISTNDIAKEIDASKNYISGIVHGRIYSKHIVELITDFINNGWTEEEKETRFIQLPTISSLSIAQSVSETKPPTLSTVSN